LSFASFQREKEGERGQKMEGEAHKEFEKEGGNKVGGEVSAKFLGF